MKLTCPNCNTSFSVPDAALQPAGRTVRCSRCAHVWFAGPDGQTAQPPLPATVVAPPPPPPPPAAEPAPVAVPQLPSVVTTPVAAAEEPVVKKATPAPDKAAPPRLRMMRTILGWAAFVLIAAGIAAGVYFHEVLAAEYPATRPFYRFTKLMPLQRAVDPKADAQAAATAAAGLSLDGLHFRTTSEPDLARFQGRDLPPVVSVTVSILNESSRPRSIRTLRGATIDAKGKALTTWVPVLSRTWLWPGETTTFTSEVSLAGERPAEIQFKLEPLE